jgi:hypothetical protein
MKWMLTVRKKRKRNGLVMFEKEAKPNFLRGDTAVDFVTEKMDDSNIDEDK